MPLRFFPSILSLPASVLRSGARVLQATVALGLLTTAFLLPGMARADAAAEGQRIQDLLRRGEAVAALPLAERSAAAHPQDAPLQFLLGVALMDLGRDDQALEVFSSFTTTWPELPDPLNNIALLHARAGRLDAALQALHEALRADPGHHAARINLGHVHLALAARAWTEAAALAPLEPALAQRLLAVRRLLTDSAR